jgi:hypothetical protein
VQFARLNGPAVRRRKESEPTRTKSGKPSKPKPTPLQTAEAEPEVTEETPPKGPGKEAPTEKLERLTLKSEHPAPENSALSESEIPVHHLAVHPASCEL